MTWGTIERFEQLWQPLLAIGAAPDGGYARHGWNEADLQCRAWFAACADERGLLRQTDAAGNLWAWWPAPGPDAVVTGSHLDSVPNGGAFDGPLGVVAAFAAVDLLRERGVTPARPIAVVAFSEEEGSRFGVACLGSRLLTGAISAEAAAALTDASGVTLGGCAGPLRPDPAALARIGVFVELHIEQGRALAELDAPVALAEGIWPHGRWRFGFTGAANHAGTTRLADRHDPVLVFAQLVTAAREHAQRRGALATVGRLQVRPNATNAVAGSVTGWLDARASSMATLDDLLDAVTGEVRAAADAHGVEAVVTNESLSPAVVFDPQLRARLDRVLGGVPTLPTGAGHDAGVLSALVPTAMLFVRNPTGVSHAPAEHAAAADCAAGVEALAAVLTELSTA